LHNTVKMRALQPELKRIKKAAAGNRQTETMMTMELYKEQGINPFSSIGLLIVQLPLFLALYAGLKRVVDNPQNLIDFSYGFVRDMPYLKDLATNIQAFDNSLFGLVDLNRKALEQGGGIYWPAMILVIASSAVQYLQIKQTMPQDKDARTLRSILRDSKSGSDQPDSAEVNAAVGRSMSYIFPVLIFVMTVGFAAALSLYWLVSGLVAYLQQYYLLKQDKYDMERIMDAPVKPKKPGATKKTVVESKTKTTGPKNKDKQNNSKPTVTIINAREAKKRRR
nr:YidC/Oxa1 family membrane protein insertase [bacterium]